MEGSVSMTKSLSKVTEIQIPNQELQEVKCITDAKVPHTFLDSFPSCSSPAIRSVHLGEKSLTHVDLRAFLHGDGSLSRLGISVNDVVSLVIPNGPELAIALVMCTCQCVAAPLDPSMSSAEFVAAFGQLGVKYVIALREHKAYDSDLMQACKHAQCDLHYILKSGQHAGSFAWTETLSSFSDPALPQWTKEDDTVLVLRTSGTTSKPKVVPLTARNLHTGAMCIGHGLSLTAQDVSLNVMPLTHIGGISCSLLASLLTGSAVICAPTFDPGLFIHWLDELRPTWYYAAPTIHKAVAIFARSGLTEPPKHCLRFIRSGAANLADLDAHEMRKIFACTVLPTYSMSECMPIAQPPVDYDLKKPGTVGVPIASSLRIVDDAGNTLPFGEDGEVCIKGPAVTKGYKDNDDANRASFLGEPDMEGYSWFRTGDKGHLDQEAFLFLTGRIKEMIKRGGEQVSPYEVEEVLLAHTAVEVAVVFGVPNEFWGEEVAAAVILKPGFSSAAAGVAEGRDCALCPGTQPPSFSHRQTPLASSSFKTSSFISLGGSNTISSTQLQDHVGRSLQDNKIPRQIVFLESADGLPKTRTGKYMRVHLASHLKLEAVDLAAATNLNNVALASDQTPPPVKPNKAIYGVRYFVAIWVMFIHIGVMPPPIQAWRSFSPSMPAFFILAGFLLCSSTTRPVQSVGELANFYKNRIVAAHPLYLLSVLFTLPLTFMICFPGVQDSQITYAAIEYTVGNTSFPLYVPYSKGGFVGPAEATFCPNVMHRDDTQQYTFFIMEMLAVLFTAQLAWPWGIKYNLGAWANGVMWFSSAYYFCLLAFPLLYYISKHMYCRCFGNAKGYIVRPWLIRYIACPVLIAWGACTALVYLAMHIVIPNIVTATYPASDGLPWVTGTPWPDRETLKFFVGYCFPLCWACDFFMGMLTFNAFEMNRRGRDVRLWPHWGKLADFLTFCILGFLPAASLLQLTEAPNYQILTQLSFYFNGENALRLCTFLLCPWIYGLATGEGCTAKFMGQPWLVNYLGPASYSMYLFHYPISYYWIIVVYRPQQMTPQDFAKYGTDVFNPLQCYLHWFDYIAIVSITTLVALLCTHVLNASLTSVFMRCVECLCCCCGRRNLEEESTLLKVAGAIKGLSGADVDATTPILECGLDSFGTSALVGILRPKFPGLRLTPMQLYNIETIGDLSALIDQELAAPGGCGEVGSSANQTERLV